MKLNIFEEMEKYGHEQVIFNYDKKTGLKCIISIHDTTLGPALGGCRMWNYPSEDEAFIDALRLAMGMTYKCAVSGFDNGGGKAVIIGDPKKDKTEGLFRAFGRYVESLNGRFYTGTDMGTFGEDFVYSFKETDCLVGLPEEYGGSGNTAVTTAFGVWRGIKATAKELYGDDSLTGVKISVQGVGKVGYNLLKFLTEEQADVTITDIYRESVEKALEDYPGIKAVEPEKIFDVECDIFSPCALGGILNDDTIKRLKCKAVAGSANNQLAESKHGDLLHEKGILYAPDFVINSGGLIQVADELEGFNKDRVMAKTAAIYDILTEIYKISKQNNISTHKAANKLAEERIEVIGEIQRTYIPDRG